MRCCCQRNRKCAVVHWFHWTSLNHIEPWPVFKYGSVLTSIEEAKDMRKHRNYSRHIFTSWSHRSTQPWHLLRSEVHKQSTMNTRAESTSKRHERHKVDPQRSRTLKQHSEYERQPNPKCQSNCGSQNMQKVCERGWKSHFWEKQSWKPPTTCFADI